ncbi:hypothetical protein [Paludisphaera sp.]|uniref:hypothetical protein n=1 Tax=Paludisphaera sp. TaxID=2017432 RepID=UPI00301D3E0D
MSSSIPKFRLPVIAVMAVVGVAFLGQGTAQACGTNPVAQKKACCTGGPTMGCAGCCDAGPARSNDSQASHEETLDGRFAPNVTVPARNCECRAEAPAAPTSKRESENRTNRGDKGRAELVSLASMDARLVPPSPWFDLHFPPQRTPLYLRVSRLLI